MIIVGVFPTRVHCQSILAHEAVWVHEGLRSTEETVLIAIAFQRERCGAVWFHFVDSLNQDAHDIIFRPTHERVDTHPSCDLDQR